MDFFLMHKNIPVIKVKINENSGDMYEVCEIHHAAHLPVGTDQTHLLETLNRWWKGRSMPAEREGIRSVLETLDLPSTSALLTKALGLSLSDHYWVKPVNADLDWKDINFFTNTFSKDLGNLLFGGDIKDGSSIDCNSPDITSDGVLRKRWKIRSGKRCLVKSDLNYPRQQAYNEVIASALMYRLGVDRVNYSLLFDSKGNPYSICEDFVSIDTEFVSANSVMKIKKKEPGVGEYEHYIGCCRELGINNIAEEIGKMIVIDYLLVNSDRHFNNFGLLRNPNTLIFTGAAPIFDSGSSLGWNKAPNKLFTAEFDECKPFAKSFDEQIKLIRAFEWMDFEALSGLGDEMREILTIGDVISEERREGIVKLLDERVGRLQKYVERTVRSRTGDSFFCLRKVSINDKGFE